MLRQASNAVRLGVDRALEDLSVTNPQFLVMTMINAYPGISGAEVARLTMLTPQTISLIVANLERTAACAARSARTTAASSRWSSPTRARRCSPNAVSAPAASMPTCATASPPTRKFLRQWLVEIATRNLTNDT